MEEEDARRSRERERPVGEQTRLVNRTKAILARFGIRHLRLSLRQAADRLEAIRTAEGTALPHNTRAELHRFLERLSLVRQQIRAIEQERERKLAAAPAAENDLDPMVRLIARIIGIGIGIGIGVEAADSWSTRSCHAACATAAPWRAMPGSPGRRTRAVNAAARRGWRAPARPACGAA